MMLKELDNGAKKLEALLSVMKDQTDNLLADDEELQKFLKWVEEKSSLVNAPYHLTAIRAFYFTFALILVRRYDFNLDIDITLRRALESALESALDRARIDPKRRRVRDMYSSWDRERNMYRLYDNMDGRATSRVGLEDDDFILARVLDPALDPVLEESF